MKSRNLTVSDCLHLTLSQETKVLVNKHKSDSVKTLKHLYSLGWGRLYFYFCYWKSIIPNIWHEKQEFTLTFSVWLSLIRDALWTYLLKQVYKVDTIIFLLILREFNTKLFEFQWKKRERKLKCFSLLLDWGSSLMANASLSLDLSNNLWRTIVTLPGILGIVFEILRNQIRIWPWMFGPSSEFLNINLFLLKAR